MAENAASRCGAYFHCDSNRRRVRAARFLRARRREARRANRKRGRCRRSFDMRLFPPHTGVQTERVMCRRSALCADGARYEIAAQTYPQWGRKFFCNRVVRVCVYMLYVRACDARLQFRKFFDSWVAMPRDEDLQSEGSRSVKCGQTMVCRLSTPKSQFGANGYPECPCVRLDVRMSMSVGCAGLATVARGAFLMRQPLHIVSVRGRLDVFSPLASTTSSRSVCC